MTHLQDTTWPRAQRRAVPALCLCAALVLAACGSGTGTSSPSGAPAPGPAPTPSEGSAYLTWDANAEPDIAGYIVFWGDATRAYRAQQDVALNVSYTVTNLPAGTHYFAVKAYDLSGNMSDFSIEVSKTIP